MTFQTHPLGADDTMPNSPLPLLAASGVLAGLDADTIAGRFVANGWQGTWVYTIFDYWHYHLEGHEVLGCASGSARVGFGGENGLTLEMTPGDIVVIPAGVGHKRLSATGDFAVVGAYPPGQNGAITRAGTVDVEIAGKTVAGLAVPEFDPVTGRALTPWLAK
ncbi:cupin domain-containing protein [Jiella mangrovi]|uniref:Cupin type-1 domain-containing protein n=1 Tax=Jiella mangrovi TaxID=2821407 RepID=A0ABS4BI00_9HYPH|nr:cupin domain-containing protein [Jiella mangrovi]MBP0616373.1 hypothetical protein [Jiella mangrovi]